MPPDRISDGKRIAELLASELSGRESGPLADLSVVDAHRDAEPAPDGTAAYAVAHRGVRIGEVTLYPEAATLRVGDRSDPDGTSDAVASAVTGPHLTAEPDDDEVVLRIESGAAVKRAVDALLAGLDG